MKDSCILSGRKINKILKEGKKNGFEEHGWSISGEKFWAEGINFYNERLQIIKEKKIWQKRKKEKK